MVLNRAGVTVRRFPLRFLEDDGICLSVMAVDWSPAGIGLDCHVNPSLGVYTVYDPDSGKPVAGYLGYGFVRSPDGRKLANAGFVPHFSPPYAHSDTVEIEKKIVYPPGGSNQAARDPSRQNVWRGVHELRSEIAWAPGGDRVAFLERVYDWRQVPDGVPYSDGEFNVRWQLVIGSASAAPLVAAVEEPVSGETVVSWAGPSVIRMSSGRSQAVFEICGKTLVPVR